jgi:hypothetical protein
VLRLLVLRFMLLRFMLLRFMLLRFMLLRFMLRLMLRLMLGVGSLFGRRVFWVAMILGHITLTRHMGHSSFFASFTHTVCMG